MKIAFERRASTILDNILRSRRDPRPYLIPANVCPVVPATFIEARQPFELIDIAEPWLEIDGATCIDRLKSRAGGYAGLLHVRPYGSERAPDDLFAELRALQPDLLLIDDKCLCRPDLDAGSISPYAGVTLFSTGHAKYADLGEGGFAYLSDAIAYRSRRGEFRESALAEVDRRCRESIAAGTAIGELPANWLDSREPERSWEEQRPRIAESVAAADAQKKRLNDIYSNLLPREIQLAPELQRWRFTLRVPNPARLIESIFAAGLFASRHYAPLGGVFAPGTFPTAARLHAQVINLFNDWYFDSARAQQMAAIVLDHLHAYA